MGSRNLDRISMTEWRGKCETVADMMRAGWRQVVARCEACRSDFAVDLDQGGAGEGASDKPLEPETGLPQARLPRRGAFRRPYPRALYLPAYGRGRSEDSAAAADARRTRGARPPGRWRMI